MRDLRAEVKAKILVELSQTPAFCKEISDALALAQHRDRMNEAYAYVRSLEPHATEKFLTDLFDVRQPFGSGAGWVRGHALALLLQLPHIDPYAILEDVFLRADENWRAVACRHVSEQYQKWPSPAAALMLSGVLRHDRSAYVRCCAAIALGEIGDAGALPALRDALNDHEHDEQHGDTVAESAEDAIDAIETRKADI